MADGSFSQFVREQLNAVPGVEFRRMFGGEGLYLGGVFFGILHQGRLLFKTDASSRADYDAAGMGPFQPNAKQCLAAYREVPTAVLEDAVKLGGWARRAAQRQKTITNLRRASAGRASRTGRTKRASPLKTRSSTPC